MRMKLSELYQNLKTNKVFIKFVESSCLSSLSAGGVAGFIGVYKINDLLLGVFVVQIMNVVADFVRIFVSKPCGKFSDKYGFARGIELANCLLLFGYISIIFTTPATKYLILVYTILLAVSSAGSYQNSFNIGYQILPNHMITQAMAIKGVFSGICSFVGAIFGSLIVNCVQANGNMVFGIHIYAQQLLAGIAVFGKIFAIAILHKHVVKAVKKINL